MTQPPAFQFYASDYLSSSKVQRMTLEEEGAYIRLLAYSWQDGFIPADLCELSRMCKVTPRKMAALWDRLRDCFMPLTEDPDKLVNARLEQVRAGHREYSSAQSMRAHMRWHPNGNGSAHAGGMPGKKLGNALQSPVSSTPIVPIGGIGGCWCGGEHLVTEPRTETYSPDFEIVWTAYPKHAGKGAAWKAWQKHRPSRGLQDIILQAIGQARKSKEWTEENGKFIPHLATWLNQRRWDDELTPTSSKWRLPL